MGSDGDEVHGIPVVIWVKGFHREQALAAALNYMGDTSRPSPAVVGHTFPNDHDHDGAWHLKWERGDPPQPIDADFEYDPNTDTVRKIDNG
jgi:hypothetical protein